VLKLIIEDDEGRKTVVPFVRDEITIGRQEGNTIRLTERNVSRRHARLVRQNGHVVVEDLGSYNGTRLNGERIAGQSPLKEGDLIQIGDYDLALQSEGTANVGGPITTKVPSTYTPSGASAAALRKTEPAMEAMGEPEPEPEAEDPAPARATLAPVEDEDGEEHDHTPPPASAEQRRHSTSIIRLDQVEADRPRLVEDVAAEDAPRLLVLAPDEFKGQEFACIRTELRIGRTDDNDIALDHRSLSRTHVKLVREESGEWRVIDMQSANGLTVNGESYAQATLGSGDIIELGHVKLRFLNAGDAADDLPASAGGARSKLPLVAGLVALLLGAGAAAFFALRSPTPVEHAGNPDAPEVVNVPSGNTPPEAPPPGNTPQAPAQASPEQRLAEAEKAIASGDLATARTVLTNALDANGRRPANIEKRLGEVEAELSAKQQLDAARAALRDGRLEDAAAALDASKSTQTLKADHDALTAQLAAALKQQAAATAPTENPDNGNPAPGQNTVPAAVQAPPDEDPRVLEALRAGRKFLKEKRAQQAIRQLRNCIQLAPDYADCHLVLGIALAAVEKPDEAADAYRRFLELAPADHPKFEQVKGIVTAYEAATNNQK
jgi:pSer/pThr/pTyr-binding forkhead associated (FHA) protein